MLSVSYAPESTLAPFVLCPHLTQISQHGNGGPVLLSKADADRAYPSVVRRWRRNYSYYDRTMIGFKMEPVMLSIH